MKDKTVKCTSVKWCGYPFLFFFTSSILTGWAKWKYCEGCRWLDDPCCWCCEAAWDVVCVVSLEPAQGTADSHGSGWLGGGHQSGNLFATTSSTSGSKTCMYRSAGSLVWRWNGFFSCWKINVEIISSFFLAHDSLYFHLKVNKMAHMPFRLAWNGQLFIITFRLIACLSCRFFKKFF